MKKLIIVTLSFLISILACTKDKLKPEDYKFYCKVDGVEWKRTEQNVWCPGCSPLQSDYYPNGSLLSAPGKLLIRAHRNIESKSVRQYILIVVNGLLKEGNNIDSLRVRDIYKDFNVSCGGISGHSLDTNYTNTFFVSKLDTIDRQIAGNFSLRVIDNKCAPSDTIMITEGHFDLNPFWHP